MKKIYTLLLAFTVTCIGYAQTNIYTQNFEVLNNGYSTSATFGAGLFTDVFDRIDASTAPGGDVGGNSTFIWAIEDHNPGSGTITLDQMDITGYTDFTFSIDMIAHHYIDWDSTDELLITYSIDGGTSQNLLSVQDIDAADAFNTPAALDTDFDGEGECGVGTTLPALSTGTSNSCTVSSNQFETFSSSTILLSGNTTLDIVLTFNNLDGTDEGLYLDNISVDGNSGGAPTTQVEFIGSSTSISEGIGTHELEFTITNEDALNATMFDVVLTSGDVADIDSYVTETVTFPAGVTADQVVELTITDDGLFEGDETLTFEIQNVSGGSSAIAGANNSFDLTINDNDPPPTIGLPYNEDFAVCGTVQWVPFSQNTPEDDVWTCTPGQYTMNGFGAEDDIDWLISNFSIDFTGLTNPNIAVTTNERFGDNINDFEEFDLRYSTDYPGFGDPTGSTWTSLTFNPNNTSTGATPSADSVTVVDASGITGVAYLAFFYDMTAGSGAEEWNITEILIQEGALPTSIELVSTSATVEEDSVSYDLEFSIANEDATNATTFDVVLTSGDTADIDSYTTQLVTFPAGSATNQTVTVTITDDAIEEGDEVFTFEIQNVAGGNTAAVGTNTTFNLTISANDIAGLLYDADFSNDGDGFAAHNSGAPPAAGPASVGPFGTLPNQWSLSYDSTPGTDGSDNTFEVLGGELQSRDWGGQGIFTSQVIDVSSIDVVDISALGVNTNANDDVFVYFYILDGGTRVETDLGITNNGDPINYTVSSLNVSGATSLQVGFEFSENGGGAGYDISEFTVIEGVAETSVEFSSTSDSVLEGAGTYDLTFDITFEDAINDTTFDVVLTSGDAADINSYTTQAVTFLAGTSTSQTVTVTITDDLIVEPTEVFTFEIQNVAGGNNAAVGTNNSFDLTIQDDDGFVPMAGDLVISEIMYNSSGGDDEWIEIYNASGEDITLDSNWRLNYYLSTFDFTGTVITNGSYLTIAVGSNGDGTYNNDNPFTPDVSTFSTPGDAATTNDSNNLVNSSATIAIIYEPSGVNTTIDTVTYDDGAPWPTAPDNNGPSLELIDVTFDNALAESWAASSSYDGGTPGAAYVAPTIYTYNGSWSPSDPSGAATAGDDIVIESGNASITSNTTCNSLTVNPGASIDVGAGITLTTSNGAIFESTSTSYSSLLGGGSVTGTIQYERFTNSNALGNDLISAPLGGQPWADFIGDFPNFIALLDDGGTPTTYAFGPFDKVTGTFVNYNENTLTTLTSGVGYRAATDSGETLTFTGFEHAGSVTVDILNTGPLSPQWNLVGNPYPSYLAVQAFLTHDVGGVTNIQLFDAPTAAIYGYDGSATNGWTVYNLANTTASTVITPGQGFFVSADATNAPIYDLEFTQAMRTSGTADDFISGRNAELTYIKIRANTSSSAFNTEFFFNANATEGFDVGYDAAIYGGTTPDFAIYSHLVENNAGDAITLQTLSSSNINDVTIPLGVKANQGEQITFSIDDMRIPSSVKVYLDDVVANTSTLLNESDYVFTPTADLTGTGRFFLRTSEGELIAINNDLDALNIYALHSTSELIISGQLKENTILNLYDIQGRKVIETLLDGSILENRIDVSSLTEGVYVVSVENNGHYKTQKVVIN